MRSDRRLVTRLLAIAALAAPVAAGAQTVRISNLNDVAFGTLSSVAADVPSSQTVCAFSTVLLSVYSVTATGSGAGGAFTLANGPATLPYDVQWSQNSGATSGTALSPGVALTGQASGALTAGCLGGLLSSGSLIVTLRAVNLQLATAGAYSGTLTILLSAN